MKVLFKLFLMVQFVFLFVFSAPIFAQDLVSEMDTLFRAINELQKLEGSSFGCFRSYSGVTLQQFQDQLNALFLSGDRGALQRGLTLWKEYVEGPFDLATGKRRVQRSNLEPFDSSPGCCDSPSSNVIIIEAGPAPAPLSDCCLGGMNCLAHASNGVGSCLARSTDLAMDVSKSLCDSCLCVRDPIALSGQGLPSVNSVDCSNCDGDTASVLSGAGASCLAGLGYGISHLASKIHPGLIATVGCGVCCVSTTAECCGCYGLEKLRRIHHKEEFKTVRALSQLTRGILENYFEVRAAQSIVIRQVLLHPVGDFMVLSPVQAVMMGSSVPPVLGDSAAK